MQRRWVSIGSIKSAYSVHANMQPRSQGLSSLPPLVIGIKTLDADGHVTTCDTYFSTGVESSSSEGK